MRNFIFVAMLFLMWGCGDSSTEQSCLQTIETAEAMMDKYQTGAYRLLQEMQPEVGQLSADLQMRYWLDCLDARNKDVHSLEKEDLKMAQKVLDYYRQQDDPEATARAYYLMGCTQRALKMQTEAVETWLVGVGIAGAAPKTTALMYEQLSSAFYYRYLYQEAAAFNDSAYHYAMLSGDSIKIYDELVDRIGLLYFEHQFDSVLAMVDRVSQFYMQQRDSFRAANATMNTIFIYNERGDWRNAARYLDFYERNCGLFDEMGNIAEGYELYYYLKGECLLAEGKRDSAEWFFRKELQLTDDWNNRQAAYKGLSEYFDAVGNQDSALYYARLQCVAADSSYYEQNNYQLQQLQSQYNEQIYKEKARRHERESESLKRHSLYVALIALIALSVAIITALWWRNRSRSNRMRVRERMWQKEMEIVELKEQLADMIRDQESSEEKIEEARMRIANLTEELTLMQQKEDKQQKLVAFAGVEVSEVVVGLRRKAAHGQKAEEKELGELHTCLTKAYPLFEKNLSQLCPNITEIELRICMLRKLNFSNKDIATLLLRQPSSISNARTRLFEKVHNRKGTTDDADLWLKGL